MFSQEVLLDIRNGMLSAIELLEHENEELRNELASIPDYSEEPTKSDVQERELRTTEDLNGLSFKNICKETVDDTCYKLSADVCCTDEDFSIEILAEAAEGKVKQLVINMDESSPLTNIKPQLCSFIKDLNISGAMNAISSYLRMYEVRTDICNELSEICGECFKFTLRESVEESGYAETDTWLITMYDGERHSDSVDLSWMLKYCPAKLTIENVFSPISQTDSLPSKKHLRKLLKKLLMDSFTETNVSPLIDLWRDIGKALVDP